MARVRYAKKPCLHRESPTSRVTMYPHFAYGESSTAGGISSYESRSPHSRL